MVSDDRGGDAGPIVWLSLDRLDTADAMRDAATAAIESGVECIVVPEGANDAIGTLARVRLLEFRGDELFEEGRQVGNVGRTDSRDDVEGAITLIAKGRTVLLETPDWAVIPLEDLVAARHGEGLTGRALALVGNADEGKLALGALEHGVDGVVLRPTDPADVKPATGRPGLRRHSGHPEGG